MAGRYPSDALALLARRLAGSGAAWVVGGSTGLALRGAELGREPRDLDIYADREDVGTLHERLAGDALDVPAESRTDRYLSVLSHYSLAGTTVELVGGFQIRTGGSRYETEVRRLLYPLGEDREIAGMAIRLVPLGHELIFNVLRERWDRCEMIGRLVRESPDAHLPRLDRLLDSGSLAQEAAELVRSYAICSNE